MTQNHNFQPGNYNGSLSSGPSGQFVVTVIVELIPILLIVVVNHSPPTSAR